MGTNDLSETIAEGVQSMLWGKTDEEYGAMELIGRERSHVPEQHFKLNS